MTSFNAAEVNKAFAATCPELKSKYASYPIPQEYSTRWLALDGKDEDGNRVVILTEHDKGFKEHYVFCKNAPLGKGYYHMLTKCAYVNLYSRLMSEGSGAPCLSFSTANRMRADQWETTRRVVYNRSRANRPDDVVGAEQAVDHMEGTKLNPVFGLKA